MCILVVPVLMYIYTQAMVLSCRHANIHINTIRGKDLFPLNEKLLFKSRTKAGQIPRISTRVLFLIFVIVDTMRVNKDEFYFKVDDCVLNKLDGRQVHLSRKVVNKLYKDNAWQLRFLPCHRGIASRLDKFTTDIYNKVCNS